MLHPAVQRAIAELSLPHQVLRCEPQWADTAEFCQHYGIPAANTCNTIVVALKTDPRTFVACLVTSSSRLDVNHKLSALTGVKRLSFASGEETAALTGMLIGGVTVVGLPAGMPLYIDHGVFENEFVIVGGGNRTTKLKLAPQLLTQLPGAVVAAIANPLVQS